MVGLFNASSGPYQASKMATTAICEELSIELEGMGEKAAHISAHSLHPTIAVTNIMKARDPDTGRMTLDDTEKNLMESVGALTLS